MAADRHVKRFKEAVVESGIRPTELRRYKKRNGDYEMRDYVALRFHDCRHAWASWCLSNGQAPANVQKWGVGGREDDGDLRPLHPERLRGRSVKRRYRAGNECLRCLGREAAELFDDDDDHLALGSAVLSFRSEGSVACDFRVEAVPPAMDIDAKLFQGELL